MIHERVQQLEAQALEKKQPKPKHYYGAAPGLTTPTYGQCEKFGPEVPYPDPVTGPYKLREGFSDTQKMRAECKWWAATSSTSCARRGGWPPRPPSTRSTTRPPTGSSDGAASCAPAVRAVQRVPPGPSK